MAQAKTLTQAELDQVLRYVSTKKYPERDRALLMTSFLAGLQKFPAITGRKIFAL